MPLHVYQLIKVFSGLASVVDYFQSTALETEMAAMHILRANVCVHMCVHLLYLSLCMWICVHSNKHLHTHPYMFSLVIETGFQILSIQHVLKFILLLPDAPTSNPPKFMLFLSLSQIKSNQIKKQIKDHKHAKQKKQTKDQ